MIKAIQAGIMHAMPKHRSLLTKILHDPTAGARVVRLKEMRKERKNAGRRVLFHFEDQVLPFDVAVCQPYRGDGICDVCMTLYQEAASQLNLIIRLFVISASGLTLAGTWQCDARRDHSNIKAIPSSDPALQCFPETRTKGSVGFALPSALILQRFESLKI